MDKRTFLKTGLIAGAAAVMPTKLISSVSSMGDEKEFKQKPLGYAYNALEPYIDAQTMEIHYSKHHAGYTRKFNAAVKKAGLSGMSVQEIFANVSKYPEAVKNNGGGYYNHSLYWKIMSPDGGGFPFGALGNAINAEFGSFESFKQQFSKAAGTVFGSGWAWLINQHGKLKIIKSSNQDNPLMDTSEDRGFPLMTIDVWEHAYYLKHQNRRKSYIDAFWNVLDWKYIGQRFEKSMS